MRLSLLDAIETEEYLTLDKEDRFELQAGEYYELCDLIHIEQKEKNLLKIKKELQQSQGQACCFQDYRELDLNNLSCRSTDLRYADFRNSRLNGTDLSTGLLIGTKFKYCAMKGANLMTSMINDANFEKADLTEADLQYCVSFTGKNKANQWKQAGYTGVSFKDSCLAKANFTGATIIGGNFEGANLTGAIFAEAQLYRSRFTQKQLEQCDFSQEQLEQMVIIQ
ncbi:MAG: pentapeptide repeat-containing protein [Hungatella sp.]|jgi:uncharacterized protein YjbI with pentapeptide repeats|nr:pentapeptide repeat-containing protein [Hungatella sp.]